MGMTPSRSRATSLADALFSTTQQRVLGLIFGQPQRSFYATEIIQAAGSGSGAVQRELARLEGSGLVSVRRLGSQKHYQANPDSPLYEELVAIARKTVGLAEPLRGALKGLQRRIRAAFVYGSVAKREDTARSDIDLMVLSDKLSYGDLFSVLEPLNERLGRTVNPTVLPLAEFSRKAKSKDSFVAKVLAQPKVWIIGGEDDLPA
jgi:predicted nucleotidyltransferase